MSLDLDAIAERAEQAISGPWHVEYFGDNGYPQRIANDAAIIAADTHEGSYPAHTAEFIAHAREDVPALVAEVRRLRTLLPEPLETEWAIRWLADATITPVDDEQEARRRATRHQYAEAVKRPVGPWEPADPGHPQ